MKWQPGIDQDVLDKASIIEPDCMWCQKQCANTEVIWTQDEESYKGYELWCYCPECDIETFKKIKP